ncbi:DUF2950 family protein [Candidatus Burkholderia verschuerenii]|uniref:DUF2950 family protein n=1 Tax=Candidatus Burkholderia verschuerenii TaxID=242163 RepID=UPI000A62E506
MIHTQANTTLKRAAIAALAATSLSLTASLAHAQAAYPTPDAAAQALTDAIAGNDATALAKVLGKDHARYVPGDSIGEQDIYQYLGAWAQGHRVVEDTTAAQGQPRAHVEVGTSGWTLPIPLVKSAQGWRFDMPAARDEVLTRRIGRNGALGDAGRPRLRRRAARLSQADEPLRPALRQHAGHA